MIINLTPHTITLISEDGGKKEYPPSGKVARVKTEDVVVGRVDGFPINKGKPVEVIDLPGRKEGVCYIVSLAVLQHCKREDLIAPDTARAVRDSDGKIIGVRGWRII